MKKKKIKITTIGGGSGQYALLHGLRDISEIDVTAIVSMVDSGGSTGRLRDELGVLPPGDILKCTLALSGNREHARRILQKRFNGENKLKGHSVGNMLLTILSSYAGSFPEGVKALGEVLSARGQVLPVTTDKATLAAELTDGTHLYGETAIDIPRGDQREKIRKTFLVPHHGQEIKVYPPVIKAILQADFIIIGPGDLYTSITPNFLVNGVKEALKKSKAKTIYVANIMTKFGETDNYKGEDFILKLESFIGKKINKAIFNSTRPPKNLLDKYKIQKASPVEMPEKSFCLKRDIIQRDVLSIAGGVIRHDSQKLAKIIKEIIRL